MAEKRGSHYAIPVEQRTRRKSFPFAYKMTILADPCAICGSDYRPTLDHIIPIACGGTNERDNLQCLCEPCNCRKNHTRTQAEMREWYATNKASIDANRRLLEFTRYNNPYDYRPVPPEFKSRRQRDEEAAQ